MIATKTTTEIDSLKIRIPAGSFKVIDERLQGTKITILEETSEVLREFKDNALKCSENGISTRFAIEVMPIDNLGNKKEYLTILVNAKLLKGRYLEGITQNNIELLYQELINFNIANFTFDSLLEGFCTDIDFKTDTRANDDEFQELLKYFKNNAIQSAEVGRGFRLFNRNDNKGIQFSDRATQQFKTNPFWKLYHKETELATKSKEFRSKYLKGQDISNLIRFEYTIKNNKHLKALNIQSNTLRTLLALPEQKKKQILSTTIKTHLEGFKRQIIKREGMKPTDEVFYNLITMQMQEGNTFEKIRDLSISTLEDKVAKSRMKSVLNQIYQEHIKGSKKDISTKNINGVLDLIGLNQQE